MSVGLCGEPSEATNAWPLRAGIAGLEVGAVDLQRDAAGGGPVAQDAGRAPFAVLEDQARSSGCQRLVAVGQLLAEVVDRGRAGERAAVEHQPPRRVAGHRRHRPAVARADGDEPLALALQQVDLVGRAGKPTAWILTSYWSDQK